MYEKSDIQKRFPVNENKLWWYYFWFWVRVYFFIFLWITFIQSILKGYLYFSVVGFLFFILSGALIIYIYTKSMTKSLYFDVTHDAIILKFKILFMSSTQKILLSNIKSIKLTGPSYFSNSYSLVFYRQPLSKFNILWRWFYWNRLEIPGFDHEMAVAFKEYIEQRIREQQ